MSHYARTCPKVHFKCQVEGCSKGHNPLLHAPPPNINSKQTKKDELSHNQENENNETTGETNHREVKVTAATGAGERVCLSVVPLKVRARGSNEPAIGTYALLDSGSEVTLCHERLRRRHAVTGERLDFTLSGMTGSTRVNSELVDIVVSSMDDEISVVLSNVRTVDKVPISETCIAKKDDVQKWPHLRDLPLPELATSEVMLVIGLQEKPALFLSLKYKVGGEKDPAATTKSME